MAEPNQAFPEPANQQPIIPIPQPMINPGNQILTIRLTESNYLLWRQQVLTAVRGHGLTEILIPTGPPPPAQLDGQPNAAHDLWLRQDQLLASWLLASISEPILISTVGLDNACQIWCTLEQAFAGQSKAKILQHKLQIQKMKKGNLTMREYLSKMKACIDILFSAGHRLSVEDQILHILAGLGSEYDPVVVSVTTRSEPFTLNDVSSLLLSFEARLDRGTNNSTNDSNLPSINLTQFNNQRRQQYPSRPSLH